MAGATYKGFESIEDSLTHAVWMNAPDGQFKALCGRVRSNSILDDTLAVDDPNGPSTCEVCGKRDPRFNASPQRLKTADRKKWDSLHAALAKAQAAEDAFTTQLTRKYSGRYQSSWLTRTEREKEARLRDNRHAIGSKIVDLVVSISPRGDRWLSGVPSHWIATELTWEDAIRPASEPLSVIVPGSYGYPDGHMK